MLGVVLLERPPWIAPPWPLLCLGAGLRALAASSSEDRTRFLVRNSLFASLYFAHSCNMSSYSFSFFLSSLPVISLILSMSSSRASALLCRMSRSLFINLSCAEASLSSFLMPLTSDTSRTLLCAVDEEVDAFLSCVRRPAFSACSFRISVLSADDEWLWPAFGWDLRPLTSFRKRWIVAFKAPASGVSSKSNGRG